MLRIYSIRDNKVGTYSNPFYALNHAAASRSFHQACNDERVQISMYPEDFDLWYMGTWEPISGEIKLQQPPEFVAAATSFAKLQKQEPNNGKT